MAQSPLVNPKDAGSSAPPGKATTHARRVPWRAIFLSLLLAPVCCYWAQAQGVDRIFSLMVPPVVLTLLLVVVNIPLRRLLPRWALTEGDLIIFYGMQAVMCAMASEWIDIIHPYIYSYGAFPHQDVQHDVLPYISDLLFFKSAHGPLAGFAEGGKTFGYFWAHLGPWWPKILAWTLLTTIVCFAMLCINMLMADQWIEREKLSFPLVQLPLAITQDGGAGPIWRDRFMWGAFAVMFFIDMLNGFAYLYPSLPRLNVRFLANASLWMTSPPWNQIGWVPIGLFPFISAVGVFMPTDLLFSCLFFFFVRKGQQLIAANLGFSEGTFGGSGLVPSAPYFSEQSWGAFLGLFISAFWMARPYLREIWQRIKKGEAPGSQSVSPRLLMAGLILSLIGMGFFGVAIGLPFFYVVVYTILFLIFSAGYVAVFF